MRLLLLILLVSFATAEADNSMMVEDSITIFDNTTSYVTLIDYTTNDPIANAQVTFSLYYGTGNKSWQVMSDSEGVFGVRFDSELPNGIEFKVDDIDTGGKDYYGIYELENIDEDMIFSLYPVGSIRGVVLDRLDNIVPFSDIKLDCDSYFGEESPTTTDRYGSFNYDYAPLGNCRVYAYFEKGIGYQDIVVRNGEYTNVIVRLDKTLVKKDSNLITFIILILIIAGLYIAAGRIKIAPRKDARKEDILTTLSAKEKNVVNFLAESKDYVSQNEVSREVGIPKTSLIRVIDSLEKKKIVECISIGKYKKLALTKWYLGRKE